MNGREGPAHTGRNILFITTDQQRFDSLGCNGGSVARTPVIDRLATEGINYTRAYNQNTVCMPARSTMLTGQYVRTHGVVANGIPLPVDAPSIAAYLAEKAGYRTALLGKAHFEPGFDLQLQFEENARAARGDTGPWRGFERAEQALHAAAWGNFPLAHYGRWLKANHPEHLHSFAGLLQAEPGGDTLAPETKNNPIPSAWYHTEWVADRTVAWLDSVGDHEPWFCWMSFPDPHHPWDPPADHASMAREHRHHLHHRPRRVAGRLRPSLQGAVPHGLAHAAPVHLASGTLGGRGAGGRGRSGRPR
jgi:arylsulfatase A-like enzyme